MILSGPFTFTHRINHVNNEHASFLGSVIWIVLVVRENCSGSSDDTETILPAHREVRGHGQKFHCKAGVKIELRNHIMSRFEYLMDMVGLIREDIQDSGFVIGKRQITALFNDLFRRSLCTADMFCTQWYKLFYGNSVSYGHERSGLYGKRFSSSG